MQKLVACISTLSALAALSGCATDPANAGAPMVEKEYVTGSRLAQRGVRPHEQLSEEAKDEFRRQSELPPAPGK